MVFVNGQKFACATCIKGHRSTTCNHGERPLHEIKKKGRPSTQCMHCKELRKAKQVTVRCICGREEGLKHAKTLSQEGRILGSDATEDEFQRPQSAEGSSKLRSTGHVIVAAEVKDQSTHSCGCLEGGVCTCCRDREGHVVVRPDKSSTSHSVFNNHTSRGQRTADHSKPGMMLFPRDSSSPLSFPLHTQGLQPRQSPDGSVNSSPSLSINSTFTGLRLSSNGVPSPLVQAASSGSPGSDHSPTMPSPMSHQHNQMHSNLCFDYTSSSDYDSDHYSSPAPYPYFSQPVTTYAVSDASDDFGERDTTLMQDNTKNRPPINALTTEGMTAIFPVSNFSASTSPMPTQPVQTFSMDVPIVLQTSTAEKSCCKPSNSTTSPVPSNPTKSSAGGSDLGHETVDAGGCGCAISASMCCCGELCACPGCLAYPNNQNQLGARFAPAALSAPDIFPNSGSNNIGVIPGMAPLNGNVPQSQSSATSSPVPKGSCCGSSKISTIPPSDLSRLRNGTNSQALNLSQALSLIGANNQNGSSAMTDDVRQALMQGFSAMDQASLESVKMQHPTLLGDNGVLICGCGCGRPTVDCADCFRDMCEFVGESQARMMKDELEFEMAMNREGGYLADLGLNMNMNMAMNMSLSMEMNTDMDVQQDVAQTSDPGLGQDSERSQTDNLPSMPDHQSQQLELQLQPTTASQSQPLDGDTAHERQLYQGPGITADQNQSEGQTQSQSQNQSQSRMQQGLQDPALLEQEQRLRLQLLEQEQMQLSQLQPSNLNHLQLDFLDDEDWSFVDEIREDGPNSMSGIERP
ncbi:hypothetical protein BGX28_008888 [Mortierella sp. GBA30]|nr:hypothetical protein BGX28_008888 [Mortierella sp. GBA30]